MTASSFVEVELDIVPPLPPKRGIAGEFARYFACSALALATDFGLYSLGLHLGFGYPVAAVGGFVFGLWVAYQLSVRFAFQTRAVANERVEFMIFAGVGVLGLLLTEALLWVFVSRVALSPMWAKVVTAGFVFVFNFGVRKALLFTRHGRAVVA